MENKTTKANNNNYHILTPENKVNRAIIEQLRKSSVHSEGTLAMATGYALTTIHRHLRILVSNGYITIDPPNIYIGRIFDYKNLGEAFNDDSVDDRPSMAEMSWS